MDLLIQTEIQAYLVVNGQHIGGLNWSIFARELRTNTVDATGLWSANPHQYDEAFTYPK